MGNGATAAPLLFGYFSLNGAEAVKSWITVAVNLPEPDHGSIITGFNDPPDIALGFVIPDRLHCGYRQAGFILGMLPVYDVSGHDGIYPAPGATAGGFDYSLTNDIEDFSTVVL